MPAARTLAELLEALINEHGLGETLDALSDVCTAKAERIRLIWNDVPLAREWDRFGDTLDRLHAKTSTADGTRKSD